MTSFDKLLRARKNNDDENLREILQDLSSVAAGTPPKYSSKTLMGRKERLAAEQLFLKMGLKVSWPTEEMDMQGSLEYCLAPFGVMHREIRLQDGWWRNSFGYMLVRNQTGDYTAIIAGKNGRCRYYCTQRGKWLNLKKGEAAKLRGTALLFYRAFKEGTMKGRDVIAFICKSLSAANFLCFILFTLIASGLAFVYPEINEMIVGSILPMKNISALLAIAVVGITSILSAWIFQVMNATLSIQMQTSVGADFISALMGRLIYLPATFFSRWSSGEIGNRIMSAASIASNAVSSILQILVQLSVIFIGVYRIKHYAPALVHLVWIFAISILIFLTITGWMRVNNSKRILKQRSIISSQTFILFSGITKIKTNSAEKRAFARWGQEYAKLAYDTYNPPFVLRIQREISVFFTAFFSIVIYYVSAVTQMKAAEYITFCAAFGMITGAILSLSECLTGLAQTIPVFDLLKPIFSEKPEIGGGKKQVKALHGDLSLNGISFRYGEKNPWIFQNLNLSINRGDYVAIVGKTGYGKSTLLRLLLGFEEPALGSISYDKEDIRYMDIHSLRRKIGCILQNGALFHDSIMKNILISAPDATEEDAWEAAKMAAIDEDIEKMPMKMHTLVSEGSSNISGGQKQRILIARAFASKPPFLILDEATSALDNISQKKITDSLEQLTCTRIVIAHRLSTIRQCSRIVVLDNGKIAEDGTYNELILKKGIFSKLVEQQMQESEMV